MVNTEKAVEPKMVNRANASTHRKVVGQLTKQQQNGARQLVALVPKPGAKSDLDESESSGDELQYYAGPANSDSSSSPLSLPSSIENLHLLSDDDTEINDIAASTSLVPYQQSSPITNPCSPSILSPNVSAGRQLHSFETTPLSPVPSTSCQVNLPSPLAMSPQVPAPLVNNLLRRNHLQSPLSPATRSSRPRVATVRRRIIPPKRLAPNWRCCKFTGSAEVEDILFEPREEKSAIEYFKLFFSDDIVSHITEQTNIYSTQTNGSSINITEDDVKDFLASRERESLKCAHIQIIGLKLYDTIKRYLHFNDNLKDDGDRYYKVRPILQRIRENCLQVEVETRFSIDEMMMPHKGTRVGSSKQYVKNKPKKWGYKIFVRAGVSGIVYDFLIYGGDDTFRFHEFTDEENSMGLGSKVVLALTKLSSNSIATIQKPVAERPPDAVRYDQIGHYPKIIITRGRCMYCTKGQTKFFCQKCEIRLCLLPDRNCFLEYHAKNDHLGTQ
ncbi:hypothetical protein HW555_010270 [Spodoptera exigua]|uniref:PiggyBac transposable element-derived protein domain-containing protein n=1 Tax=Spodoptera exigua TaxID=7107 RepID=A0A835GBH9_SPOEX|nr:hypothetical protein HW555_010270 [Spodoptera exigua]